MFGSIYIGLSGLSAYSQGLKTVSNNVSNLNTAGFKASDVTFSDVYGAGSVGGLQYGSNLAGQGHGVSLSDISINFGQGELRHLHGPDVGHAEEGPGAGHEHQPEHHGEDQIHRGPRLVPEPEPEERHPEDPSAQARRAFQPRLTDQRCAREHAMP